MHIWEDVLARLQEVFNVANLDEVISKAVSNLIVATLTFLAFYVAWLIVRFFVELFFRRTNLDKTSQAFVRTVLKYGILLIGLVNALSTMGVDTAGLLTSLGIVGITVGFAAKDAFSNLISGILIYLDRPFVIGDLVEVGEFYGRVDEIKLRSTRIVTSDGKMLAVPNTEIINKTVTSYTNFPHLRLDVEITIGVDEKVDRVRDILLGVIKDDPAYLDDPAARVILTQLNDYNVAVELQAWIKDERSHVEKRTELREKIFNALNEAAIDMPFETIQLTPVEVKTDRQ